MDQTEKSEQTGHSEKSKFTALPAPVKALQALEQTSREIGGAFVVPEDEISAIGRTMFDTPQSHDNTIVVLMPAENIVSLPSQSLVRIESKHDKRTYIGMVTAGPFAEPDGLRADAPLVVTTTVRGIFLPRFHGRVHVELISEVLKDGTTLPPRFRPLPNSPVFALSSAETASTLQINGDISLGRAIGHDDLRVSFSGSSKAVLPRHTAVLGTTGGGKSTTVSGLIANLQKAGIATILFDTEGEYTDIDQPTSSASMLAALKQQGLAAAGVPNVHVMHLTGRETTATPSKDSKKKPIIGFGLKFEDISPYMVMEILSLTDAQQARFLAAYDVTRKLLRDFNIFPRREHLADDEKLQIDLDEMERGFPQITLQRLYDVAKSCAFFAAGGTMPLKNEAIGMISDKEFKLQADKVLVAAKAIKPDNAASWRVLQGRLGRLLRLRIFDTSAPAPDYAALITPGRVTVIDLSDTESPELNNMVIASLLRGLQLQQDRNYEQATKHATAIPRATVIIEEAHEFLSANRIRQMPALFQQVARIAKRGRKRWLGLMFVTQLPQHLPNEVLGLTNNYILHKIGDANVINDLRRAIGRIDDALWDRLGSLAPGQAIVAFEGLTRPLMVSIDPTPCKLRMTE